MHCFGGANNSEGGHGDYQLQRDPQAVQSRDQSAQHCNELRLLTEHSGKGAEADTGSRGVMAVDNQFLAAKTTCSEYTWPHRCESDRITSMYTGRWRKAALRLAYCGMNIVSRVG